MELQRSGEQKVADDQAVARGYVGKVGIATSLRGGCVAQVHHAYA